MQSLRGRKGFTLIELLVAIALLAVAIAGFISLINPVGQFQKARDSKRKSDLHQIRNALQAYYTEIGKYPPSANNQISSATWGSVWLPYIKKVPEDPLPDRSYFYEAPEDRSWFRLFAKLERCDDSEIVGDCNRDYNYSLVSPNLSLAAFPTPTPGPPTLPPTSTPTPGPTATPAPPRVPGGILVFISTQNQPQMMRVNINPFDPGIGVFQSITIDIRDTTGNPITQVSATVRTDSQTNTYPFALSTGSNLDGTWLGTWQAGDTHDTIYNITFTAASQIGSTSKVDVQLEGSLANLRGK